MAAAFPSVLVECIRDARLPLDSEIAVLATKIWDEGLRLVPGCHPETASRIALQVLSAGLG